MKRILVFYLLLFGLSLRPSILLAQDLFGPVSVRNQYPLSQFHSSLAPQVATVLAPDALRFHGSLAWSSTFLEEDSYTLDGETLETRLAIDYGVDDALSFGVELPLFWRGGGALDSFLDSWHQFFGLPRGGRNTAPKNRFLFSGTRDDEQDFAIQESGGIHAGNPVVHAKYALEHSENFDAALISEIGLPSFDAEYGQNGGDLTLGVLCQYQRDWFGFYTGAAYLYYSDDSLYGIDFRQHRAEGFMHVELRVAEWFSFTPGLYAGSRSVENLPGHGGYDLYLDLAGKARVAEQTLIDILVREDLGPDQSRTDVTFLLGLSAVL